MGTNDKTFYYRLLAVVAAVLVVLAAARLLSFPGGKAGSADRSSAPVVLRWQDANKHYGEYCTVEGRIVDTFNHGNVCFLNFNAEYKRSFTAVIFSSSFGKFPPKPESVYRGKNVRVTGVIKKYSSRPEMILESPEQIEVVE